MKKVLGLSLLVLGMQFAHAQTFKPFKVDVSLGYASPQGSGSKGGVLFAIEPKYALQDQLSVGLRLESAITAVAQEINGQKFTGDVSGHGSYLLTGDYYFSNNKFRPFGGAGAGLFTSASVKVDNGNANTIDVPSSNKFGFMLRGGFEAGHFRTGVEYNFVSDKNGYLGVKLGICIGGGRRN